MRHWQHTKPTPRRLITAAVLLLCAGSGMPAIADEIPETLDSVEAQMRAADERLRELEADIIAGRERKQALQDALQTSQAKLGERQERVQSLGRDIVDYDARLDALQADIAAASGTVAERKQQLTDALRRSQRIAGDSGLKALLQHDDPALANRLSVYADYALRAERAEIERQIDALGRIEAAEAVARKDRNWLNYIQRKAAEQRDGLAANEADQRRNLQAVDANLSEQTRTVAELKADQQRLQVLMEDLEATAGRASGYFAAGQGSWPMPVAGQIEARFGEPKSVGHINWEGLFIRADEGREVRAIADGEVVYSDWLNGFGMLVIVDHGDAWMSLYGGNREVLVDPGGWVESGATIATVGDGIVGKGIVADSGGHKAHGVYFEIRHESQPVDPEDWVSPGNGA